MLLLNVLGSLGIPMNKGVSKGHPQRANPSGRAHFRSPMLVLVIVFSLVASSSACADWPMSRGNIRRTGRVDTVAGPASSPKVLWAYRGKEHFIASPVPGGNSIIVSGLGAFNTSSILALSTDAEAKQRVVWSKSSPYLKLPISSSPAIVDGKVVLGDGMHQTNGARLHCLRLDDSRALWQFPQQGNLIHMEGAPTIANGKVFLGGGNAGVLCIDMNRASLDGAELDLPGIEKRLAEKWTELQAKFEVDKKKDPDFAIPPSDEMLPKPQPKLVWQQGAERWHVDAPVAVSGEKVIAASAFLDEEKTGERALFCLSADKGAPLWQVPLKLNPWSGATIVDDLVIFGGSNIRFDPKLISTAQGEVAAVALSTGEPRWQRKVSGGVLGPVCAVGSLVVFGATDGKVRALDLATGRLKWTYVGQAPFFAGPAADDKTAFVADLAGVVHAIDLESGAKRWSLDLASDPAVKAPGMVYGSPVLHQGRLYVATCNIEQQAKETVVVCLGEGK